MLQLLADNTFLLIFLVITLGAVVGAIPVAGIRFGAAGTLFVGLAVGALIPEPVGDLAALQSLGLGLFVYLVGLEAGESFFKELKSQFGVIASAMGAIIAGAAAAVVGGLLLGVSREITVGIFSGALTNTPSLSLAQSQTGSELPAVGYSLAYPTGVVVAILVLTLLMNRKWKAPKDSLDEGDAVLDVLDIRVGRTMSVDDFVEAGQGRIQISTVRRAGRTTIVDPDEPLEAGDVVTVVAAHSVVDELVKAVGTRVRRRWPQDRNIAVSRFTVSDDELVGRPISELNLHDRLGSTITRVRRLDTRMVATADTYLELGDVVEVAHPANRQEAVTSYFGDSRRSISEVDLVALAGGLTLGYLAALVVIPLPAGASFALGSAAGPLIVGLVLGALQKSRLDINWKLPGSANFTLRQFGLMIFLAAVGISSGPAFASTALSMTGLLSVALGAVVTVVTLLVFFLLMRVLGQSIPRASGGAAGIMSQPAVLQFATSRLTDSRVMNGYSTVVTLAVITKIVMVPLMLIII